MKKRFAVGRGVGVLAVVSLTGALAIAFQNCGLRMGKKSSQAAATDGGSQFTASAQSANSAESAYLNPISFSSVQSDSNCLQNTNGDACIFIKNPVTARGSAFPAPVDLNTDLSAYQTYAVRLTGQSDPAFLSNASIDVASASCRDESASEDGTTSACSHPRPIALQMNSQGNWKYPANHPSRGITHLMAYYWLNFQIDFMQSRSEIFFAKNRGIKVDPYCTTMSQCVNNAFYDRLANQIKMGLFQINSQGARQPAALSSEIYIHEMGHANITFGSNHAIYQNPNVLVENGVKRCATANGCSGAIDEGQADFHAALLFPENTASGETVFNNPEGMRTNGLLRNVAQNSSLTAAQAFNPGTPGAVQGEIHNMGYVYAAAWWSVYTRPQTNRVELEKLFTEHLRVLAGTDTFETALSKILVLDQRLFGSRYSAAFTEEFQRRGIRVPAVSTTSGDTMPTNADPEVIGTLDQVSIDRQGNYVVEGWACKRGAVGFLQFRVLTGGPLGQGTLIETYSPPTTSLVDLVMPTEEAVRTQCNTTGQRRFRLPLRTATIGSHLGQPIYVYAFMDSSGHGLLTNSGQVRLPTPSMNGTVDGVIQSGGETRVNGWACISSNNASVPVHLYLNGPSGSGGAFAGAFVANLASEGAVGQACGSATNAFRFSIPLSSDLLSRHAGNSVYVYGISPVGNAGVLLARSGEHRLPASTGTSVSPAAGTCTEAEYLARRPDVLQAGTNPFVHYMNFGRNEGMCRVSGPCTRPVTSGEYLQLLVFTDGPAAAAVTFAKDHYDRFGRNEGRCPLHIFSPQEYLAANPDLQAAFGSDLAQARQHFIDNVVRGNETRPLRNNGPALRFDPEAYLSANPDVRSAGANAQEHYVSYGLNEGRALK